MARLKAGAALLLAFVSPATFAAEFKLTRWSEDWSAFADPALRKTPLDTIKYLPLDDAGDYLSLGGQLRYKAVSSGSPLFGLGKATSDGYVYQRLNLHADLHVGAPFRAFVELGDARVYGKNSAPTATDSDRGELMQAFADFTAQPDGGRIMLRLGRQELQFDNAHRFVALREGPNVRRAFDGVQLIASAGVLEATAFMASPVADHDDHAFDDRSDHKTDFAGLRLRYGAGAPVHLDTYWYRYSRDLAAFGAVHAPERRNAFGLQSDGRSGGFDWDVEAVYENGRFGSSDIRAWAFGSLFGYSLSEMAWRPRIGLQFDAASGDRNPNDQHLQTFNPLFPKGSYFSQAGLTDFSNLVHAAAVFGFQPLPDCTLSLAAGHMARQSRADAAYAQPMLPIPHSITGSKGIGNYLRINASYRINAHLNLAAEAMRDVPEAALRDVGARTADYAELVMKFLF